MDLSNLVPIIAAQFGLQPSTLLGLIMIISTAANITTRLIPNDATGWRATVRQVCAVIGFYVSSRVTSGTTVNDVALAAAKTPPIAEKAAAIAEGTDTTKP